MQFEYVETDPKTFAGKLTVIAETPAEVLEVAEHFQLFDRTKPEELIRLAEAIKAGRLAHVSAPQKRAWYLVESALDHEFTKPYLELLEKVTGYTGDLPDLDLTPHHPRRLRHTHITISCYLEHGHYCFEVADQSEPWNGMKAQEYAQKTVEDYCQEELGWRSQEREYIEERGRLIRNPNYLKRHRPKPGTGAPWLWAVLFRWWLATHGTDAQREAVRVNEALMKGITNDADWMIRDCGHGPASLVGYGGLRQTWKTAPMSWDEFKKLGK